MTVLIATDDDGLRSLLRRLLGKAVTVLGKATTGEEAVRLAESLRPHVVLMSISLAGLDSIPTTGRIKAMDPRIRVVLITGHEEAYLDATGKSGADVLLPRRDVRAEILSTVRSLGPRWDGRERRLPRPSLYQLRWMGRNRRAS